MKPFKLVVIPLAVMTLMVIGRGEAAAAPPPAPESEIVTTPGYQSQMPCTQPEMMQMMDQGSSGATSPGSAPGGGGNHAAHHPATGVGALSQSQSGSSPDLISQLTMAVEQASGAIQAIGSTPGPLSTTQKGVTVRWTDQLRVVQ